MKNKIFIGDNLDILNSSVFSKYHNSIKVIYIDPPYNTKTKKTYNDNNTDWLCSIKKRLEVSRNYLKEDGVIFISIDDNEYAYLKVACDFIFGKENFLGTFITNQAMRSNTKFINTVHEYVLCFAKNHKKIKLKKIPRIDMPDQGSFMQELITYTLNNFRKYGQKYANLQLNAKIKEISKYEHMNWIKNYNNVDEFGKIYFAKDLSTPSNPRKVAIDEIKLYLDPLKTRGWVSDKKFIELFKDDRLVFKANRPYCKHYLDEAVDNIYSRLNFYSRNGSNDLNKLGLRDLFDTPKPVELIKFLLLFTTSNNDIILDFYAGSGTTAQAVYEINKEYDLSLKYILIQDKEPVNPKSKSYMVCKKLNIKPFVSDIMLYRINTYLKLNNKTIDYERSDFNE